jgi:hypothetical protein
MQTTEAFSKEEFKLACKRIAEDAAKGCGLSDVLFSERLQDGIEAKLSDIPQEHYEDALAIAKEQGYDPDYTPYEAREGECSLTGIDEYCCPCGRHE